jgi:glycosyltransferase involved in cell wall biosynthesis
MHLVIASAFSYPDGGAAAARHRALATGLTAAGHRVSIVLLRQVVIPAGLERDGIDWIAAAPPPPVARVTWRLNAAKGLREAMVRLARAGTVDALLLTTQDPILMETGIRSARALGIPALHELTEYPDVVRRPGPWGRVTETAYRRRYVHRLDGVFVISTALREYVAARTDTPTRLLGAVVDIPRHPPLPALPLAGTFVVGYAGHLSQAKDGVLDLLAATSMAVAALGDRVEVRVELIGDASTAPAMQARQLAADLGLTQQVDFHGQVPHSRVRDLLAGCHLLVLPRPASRQAEGGFPTKLGEYLSTARPVLVTSVGDIPRHLRDGDNAVMVPPGDVPRLAAAMVGIAQDYDRARKIGANGRLLVESCFAATHQAPIVAAFVAELSVGVR